MTATGIDRAAVLECLGRAEWHIEAASRKLIEPAFAAACDELADDLTKILSQLVSVMADTQKLGRSFATARDRR